MNVASLVSNHYTEIENRKRALRQKSADDAYRKNAQYFKPKFNPALEELVGLLTGKKEQEHQPEVQAAIRDLQQHKGKVVRAMVETDATVEKSRNTEKMKEDYVSGSFIQQTQGQSTQESKSSKVIQINGQEIVENATTADRAKVVREKVKQRLFEKAISRYSFHVQMAKQGFQFAQPTIYRAV
ncbi:hypothetical protein [Rummeliibacillus pycnus]|uniref:hypothetical protein n=1 Tax=Rummeliibacillus pycnus TaxID=101070 RepID=UPI003D269EC8